MIKVDFDQLWSEFNERIRHIRQQEHETNKYKQHLNIYARLLDHTISQYSNLEDQSVNLTFLPAIPFD